jgi:hypothetical protein
MTKYELFIYNNKLAEQGFNKLCPSYVTPVIFKYRFSPRVLKKLEKALINAQGRAPLSRKGTKRSRTRF